MAHCRASEGGRDPVGPSRDAAGSLRRTAAVAWPTRSAGTPADQEHFVAQAGNSLADQRLTGTVPVHLGRVDQRHAKLNAGAKRGDLLAPAILLLAHHPRALSQTWHRFTAGQINGAHRPLTHSRQMHGHNTDKV